MPWVPNDIRSQSTLLPDLEVSIGFVFVQWSILVVLKLSICDVIVLQKGSNGDGKLNLTVHTRQWYSIATCKKQLRVNLLINSTIQKTARIWKKTTNGDYSFTGWNTQHLSHLKIHNSFFLEADSKLVNLRSEKCYASS